MTKGDETLTTPFRAHLEHCQQLGTSAQVVECADYIQHIDILVSEFLESYYMVERLWDPQTTAKSELDGAELVLEPFYESLEFALVGPGSQAVGDPIVCVSGALSPLQSDGHPALTRHGLDFVGLHAGSRQHMALGAVQSSKTESAFLLLLRALNGLAELSPPLRMAQLGSDVLHGSIPEDADFSLYLGVAEREQEADVTALVELSRDLAEAFVCRTDEIAQFSGTLAHVACMELDSEALASGRLQAIWQI
jgi:hypothetical protein